MANGAMASLNQTTVDRLCTATGNISYSPVFDRRVAVGPPPDNTPVRPFFQIGEAAPVISRLVNSSTRVAGESRSTVTYSMLRTNPTTTSELNTNYERDMQVEQEFREISNAITTRGNSFRILYAGQSLKNAIVLAEYLGEAFVERHALPVPDASNPDAVKTSDSTYIILANRVVTE